MAVALPHAIEQQLAALIPRVRALRVVRGVCMCAIAATFTTVVILLLDAMFTLPASVRGVFVAVWVTALGVLAWRVVVRPWQVEISLADVAGELEKRLPELGDRLRAVVREGRSDTSEAVYSALVEDTTRRAKAIDFRRAIPTHRVALLVCGAIVAFNVFLICVGLVTNSSDRLRRIVMPWSRPPGVGFRVIVTSGEPVVNRGGSITLAAFAEKFDSRVPTPASAMLVLRDFAGAPEERLQMVDEGGGGGGFHATRTNVERDFEYRVEIGSATSEWFRVTALDAVEIAEGTSIIIVPPRYAKQPNRPVTGFTNFDGLLFSEVRFLFKFKQPATAANLEWQIESTKESGVTAVELAQDRLSATGWLLLIDTMQVRLVLVREVGGKQLRTTTTINVRVEPDQYPWFEQVSGITTRPRTARPGARIPIHFVACDDMSVTSAALIYVVGTDELKTTTIPIQLQGAGTKRVTGRHDFDLPENGREGETIRYRILLHDNQNVNAGVLSFGPHEVHYPTTGWSELRLSATALPLELQDILCQRDAVNDLLTELTNDLNVVVTEIESLSKAIVGHATLEVDLAVRLNKLRERNCASMDKLHLLARETTVTPELRPIATGVSTLADGKLKAVAIALGDIDGEDASLRAEALRTSATLLREAVATLSELSTRNAKIAQERLDHAKLGILAADQTALASRANVNVNELLDLQRELLNRLKAVHADSETLRLAATGAKFVEARRLALVISHLNALLHDFDTAASQTAANARAALAADIARYQESLMNRAAKLFATVDIAARLAGVALPKREDFHRANEFVAAGKTVQALTELEKHAQAIERIANEFDRWAADRAEPKFVARQLALWQDDILARFTTATKSGAFDELPDSEKTAFRAEQQAIHTTLVSLAIPTNPAVKSAHDNAIKHTTLANKFLASDGRGADTAMNAAVAAFNNLADKTPTIAERLAKTRGEFEKLRLAHGTLASAVEQALRGSENQTSAALVKKLAPFVEPQRKLREGIAALDLPGFNDRQTRVIAVLNHAVADLQDGSAFDVQTSQLQSRREFERLKISLDGLVPPDAKAEELHRKCSALAESLKSHGANLTAKHLEHTSPLVQDFQRQLATVIAPESPTLFNDAKVAIQFADTGFRDGSKPDEIRRRIRAAAQALGKLADRMHGYEPDLDRVKRLAEYRRLAVVRVKDTAITSDDSVRQLMREVDELSYTRVGAAGQLHKKRLLDLYTRLRGKKEVDRYVAEQKALAEALDELAAMMADIADLATNDGRGSLPTLPPHVDSYLPSKAFAESLRDFANQQRTHNVQLANFARELANRLRPAETNPFPPLEAKQRTLATDVLALAPEAEPAGRAARMTADSLHNGNGRAANVTAVAAVNHLRHLAISDKRAEPLAARQQSLVADITKLQDDWNAATAQQVYRADELAAKATELATTLKLAARAMDPLDTTAKALADSATLVKEAERQLLEAAKLAMKSNTSDAARLRAAGGESLRSACNLLFDAAPAIPVGPHLTTGDALRRSELAMRKAIDDLATSGDIVASQRAMNEAATALREATKPAPMK